MAKIAVRSPKKGGPQPPLSRYCDYYSKFILMSA